MPNDFGRVLADFGLSLVEYEALICPYYDIPLGLEKMAHWTVREQDHGRSKELPPGFNADDYRIALQSLIAKGWLHIQDDAEAEREQYRLEDLPRPEDLVPDNGVVTFTRWGYLQHRRILRREHGLSQFQDILELNDEQACILRLYARTQEQCQKLLANLDELQWHWVAGAEIESITGPEPTGSWRPRRFRRIRQGYLMTLTYREKSESQQ